jgi:hypothetical protein
MKKTVINLIQDLATPPIQKDHFGLFRRFYYRLIRNSLDDRAYALMSMRRWLGGGDIDNPKTFNEKLQWLKLHHRNQAYTQLADKYAVRRYVEATIGADYLNECYAVYQGVAEIDWERLSSAFIMKATHGSGMNIFVKNMDELNREQAMKTMNQWLRTRYSDFGREWVYQDIPPRIMVEKLLFNEQGRKPYDYKVYCFNGSPVYIQVDIDRFGEHKRLFYDSHWVRQPFTILYEEFPGDILRPLYLDAMLAAAKKLATNIPYVRVDFYALPKLIFGEMTFYPENAVGLFHPPEWDLRLGEQLNLQALDVG